MTVSRPAERGFTLIEVLITAVILGILATLAVGYSGTFFAKSRLNTLVRGCYTATSVARAEAVRNSRHTQVAFESNRCVAFYDSLTGGTQWTYDQGIDTTLYTFNYSDANLTAADLTVDVSKLTQSTSNAGVITPSIIFNASGYSVLLTSTTPLEQPAATSVTFKNKNIPASANVMRRIDVTVAGAVRVMQQ